MRHVLVETKQGFFRLEVPEGAKVTFGPLVPSRNPQWEERHGGGANLYLRVYKTPTQQYAVIPGVISFRDESLGFEELIQNGGGTSEWKTVDLDFLLAGRTQEVMKKHG